MDALARQPYSVPISCVASLGTDVLLEQMWRAMDLRRIYTKKVRASQVFTHTPGVAHHAHAPFMH